MKKDLFIWSMLWCGSGLILLWSVQFQHNHHDTYKKIHSEWDYLRKKIRIVENHNAFFKKNQNEITFLQEKGWFIPKNRLIANEVFGKLNNSLNNMRYIFEPEIIKKIEGIYIFRVTQIYLEGDAFLDMHIYMFLQEIFKKFTGVLRTKEIILTRGDELDKDSLLALKENKKPQFMQGKFVFEWISMGEENDEE